MSFDPKSVYQSISYASIAEGSYISMAWIDENTFMLNDENAGNLTYHVEPDHVEITYAISGDHVYTIHTKNDLQTFINNMIYDIDPYI